MPEQTPEVEAVRRELVAGRALTNEEGLVLLLELDRVSGAFDQVAGAVMRYHQAANIPERRKS